MSLEAALDEERKAVMDLLEGKSTGPRPARDSSPAGSSRAQSPSVTASPLRSMLDVDDTPSPSSRKRRVPAYRLMLDASKAGSPPPNGSRSSSHPNLPSSPRTARGYTSPSRNPESAYQFEMLPTIESHSMPKRVTQGGKKNPKPRAMSSVYGSASESLGKPAQRERHNSFGSYLVTTKGNSSKSGRSQSPGGKNLSAISDPKKYVTESGKVVDMNTAYRKMSDSALLRSGGALANLPIRKGSDPTKGESLAPGGGVRLATDDFGDDEDAIESSDDDESDGSSDGEGWGSKKRRGRRRTRQNNGGEKHGADKAPKSLLAAAEDERKHVSSSYVVRSMLEPTINITGPDGERMISKKSGVHPHTNYDHHGGSGLSTPFSSDTEADFSEMKAAQQLAMNISPIHSSPEAHRCVRQILRGKYGQFQEDAENGMRRQRVYLVATDISEEAAYALEWTIGTVLRDGDTLLAVYAVDEETGVGGADGSGVAIGGGATAQQETDSLMKTLSNANHISEVGLGPGPSPLQNSVSASESDVNLMGKAEKDRYQAAVEVSDRCVKLLRKTRLQVRIVVEVFHCKSPKHMITEVIDFLEPTLVILGSRGRSALKGVLLGSFSNYLVTKSSVPVMVARKRLRKHSKYKRRNLRLSNMLTNPSDRLANAKID